MHAADQMIWSAPTEAALRENVAHAYGPVDIRPIDADGAELLIVISEEGSGLSLKTAFVYVRTRSAWELLAFVRTNTSHIDVLKDIAAKRVILRSKAKRQVLVLPFDSLELGFDRSEQ